MVRECLGAVRYTCRRYKFSESPPKLKIRLRNTSI
jgi:hypothetical protein